MQTPHHQYQLPATSASDMGLRAPAEQECIAAARERAFQRLYEDRLSTRALAFEAREMRRRDFFRAATLGAVAAVAYGKTVHTMAGAKSSERPTSVDSQAQDIPRMFALEHTGKFVWENLLFQVGQFAFALVVQEHRLPVGNASLASSRLRREDIERTVELFEKNSGKTFELYSIVGVVAPIVEEMVFRVFPSLITQSPGMQWQVGIPLNIMFALMHSAVPESVETNLSFPISGGQKISLDYLPISQFVLGAFCWYCARSYGALAPILTHGLNNQIPAIVFAWGGKETHDKFQQLFAEELAKRVG